jgi:hypothetical protein
LAISLSMIVCRALAIVRSNEIRRVVRSGAICFYRMPQRVLGFRRFARAGGRGSSDEATLPARGGLTVKARR